MSFKNIKKLGLINKLEIYLFYYQNKFKEFQKHKEKNNTKITNSTQLFRMLHKSTIR